TSRECSMTGGRLSRTGLPVSLGSAVEGRGVADCERATSVNAGSAAKAETPLNTSRRVGFMNFIEFPPPRLWRLQRLKPMLLQSCYGTPEQLAENSRDSCVLKGLGFSRAMTATNSIRHSPLR